MAGVGLGLAIVKRIIDAHRGEVSVRSQRDVGTVFTIDLPLAGPGAAA
jgi:signal transduction histidine kinase